MSYCRFSEGDVYMYEDVNGGITCCACLLMDSDKYFGRNFKTYEDALLHLNAHKDAGHNVPQRAFDCLNKDIEFYGKIARVKNEM